MAARAALFVNGFAGRLWGVLSMKGSCCHNAYKHSGWNDICAMKETHAPQFIIESE
jgi:hypothetical protein